MSVLGEENPMVLIIDKATGKLIEVDLSLEESDAETDAALAEVDEAV